MATKPKRTSSSRKVVNVKNADDKLRGLAKRGSQVMNRLSKAEGKGKIDKKAVAYDGVDLGGYWNKTSKAEGGKGNEGTKHIRRVVHQKRSKLRTLKGKK